MTHTIDRQSPAPLWSQLLESLRQRLAAGEFNDRFPTDRELTETYQVSRHTAREAVRHLTAEGVLERHRGRGSTVLHPEFEQPLGALYSMFRSIEAQGVEQRSEVLALDVRRDAAVAKRLGRHARSGLLYLARVRLAGGVPLALDQVWLPAELTRPLLVADFTHTALYDELHRQCAIVLDRATERIAPVLPTAEEAQRLAIDEQLPCFVIERLGYRHDEPLEWRQTIIRGDRFAFVATWEPGSSPPSSFELTPGRTAARPSRSR